ncbi:helix-turn-helix transcriptional regulator [Alkanindiges sp. WGS2144]|uniref:helix-turn-helix transcriptional regulator n=1 Tax=Alkanindiges sp. WGS2144 TaxID=3366808 RepID=UPI0037534D8B
MEAKSSKHEKLADRLASILIRLNSGEKLNPKQLADEYKTHVRTILRDFDRLSYLPLEKDEQSNRYYLPSGCLGKLNEQDIKNFAQISGISKLYPKLNLSFLRELMDSRASSIYSPKGYFFEDTSQFSAFFDLFKEAIQNRRQIGFLYKGMPRLVQPYRIIHHHGSWYLAAVRKGELRAYRLSRISLPRYEHQLAGFEPDPVILKQLENEESIWFGQDKQEIVLTVHPDVALHFKQRQLLPEQQIIKELDDGGILVSSRVVKHMQILPLVRYWVPHVRIVSPPSLQGKLENELKGYLGV